MITRREYMSDSEKLHHRYYLEMGREAGISYAKSQELPRIKEAIKNGDKHLNTIPLKEWDNRGNWTQASVNTAMLKRGDSWSLAGSVCVHKAVALEDALREMLVETV